MPRLCIDNTNSNSSVNSPINSSSSVIPENNNYTQTSDPRDNVPTDNNTGTNTSDTPVVYEPYLFNVATPYTGPNVINVGGSMNNFTGFTNGDVIYGNIALYDVDSTMVNEDIYVEFGYIPRSSPVDASFKPLDMKNITVGTGTTSFSNLMSLNTFYSNELGNNIIPSFNFSTTKSLRLQFSHMLYDYGIFNSNDSNNYFKNIINNFAFRITLGSGSLVKKYGVAVATVLPKKIS